MQLSGLSGALAEPVALSGWWCASAAAVVAGGGRGCLGGADTVCRVVSEWALHEGVSANRKGHSWPCVVSPGLRCCVSIPGYSIGALLGADLSGPRVVGKGVFERGACDAHVRTLFAVVSRGARMKNKNCPLGGAAA